MLFNKLNVKAIILMLVIVAMAMAGEYSFLVKNETTQNSGTNLSVQIQTTTNSQTTGRAQTNCIALRSYGDGKFYFSTAIDSTLEPKLTFYTNGNCRINSIGSIEPFAGTEPVSENIILTISDTGISQANSPDPIPTPDEINAMKKVIRFFAPWNNASAILYVASGDSAKMTTVKNYCGWFEAAILPPEGSFQVYFKQNIGTNYFGSNGMTQKESAITPINLDSALALSDTVWIVARPSGAFEVHTSYPNILGDCPTKTLPVMMFDWLHGTKGDGDVKTTINRIDSTETISYGNGAKDQDPEFGPIYATSNDFGSGGCGNSNAKDSNNRGFTAGMVEPTLGANGVPVRATNFPENCKITEHLNQWFLPQVVATKNGKDYSNATCRSIELVYSSDGFWLGQKDKNSPEGGLFLLDDFEFLDEEKTIKNPFYDNIAGSTNKRHNYGFTMKIQASFEYIPGQYFEFFGDDDVWVFINNKLVMDIGGQHAQVFGSVNLDTLGLVEGANYPFHIFYAERHVSESNFMMRTSINLEIPSNITIKDLSTDSTLIKKEIWQKIHENALSCDFSISSQNKQERGPSTFTLFGGNLPTTGVQLDKLDTAYYSGITISNNFTTLTINTKSISQAQALTAGSYYVRTTLKSIPNEHEDVHFSISAYQAASNGSTNAKSSSSNAKTSSSSNKPTSSNSASGKSSSSKNNSKSNSSGVVSSNSKAVSSSSSKTSNSERPDFYVKMTGPFEFEIVMDESVPSLVKKYAVMDMKGQVLSVGELNDKNALVNVPNRGAYIVKLGLSYQRVNIR